MSEFLKILPILLLSSVKFLPCPSISIAAGFSVIESIMITTCGGLSGAIVFFRSAEYLMERSRRRRILMVLAGKRKPPKVFSRYNRVLVQIKMRFGLVGIALITPVALSIPIGSLVMAKFFKHKSMALPSILISVLSWSLLLSILTAQFHVIFYK
jgi:hypothetical protein